MSPNHPPGPTDDAPPVMGSWRNVYLFVLVLHVALIVFFYLFSQAYA